MNSKITKCFAAVFAIVLAFAVLLTAASPSIPNSSDSSDSTSSDSGNYISVSDNYSEFTTDDIVVVDEKDEGTEYKENEVMIRFQDGTTKKNAKAQLSSIGLSMDEDALKKCLDDGSIGVATIKEGNGSVSEVLDKIKEVEEADNSCIAYAQANYIYETSETNDTYSEKLWHLDAINAYDAWEIQKTDNTVSVAVIDTGVDSDHEDLAANLVAGYNSVDGSTDYDDINGHGSHVAGIIASVADNETGTAGVSYNANIIPVMAAYDPDGYFATSDLVSAFDYLLTDADGNGVADLVEEYNLHVINMSLGSLTTSLSGDSALLSAIDAAYANDILTVCAAGNNGTSSYYTWPADYDTCVSVIALDSDLTKASYSNYGASKDISAPGTSIFSTYWGNSYKTASGTSMASPVVAGAAALVFASDSDLTASDVKAALLNSAQDIGDEGFDNETANGCVDMLAALEMLDDTFTVTFDGGDHAQVTDGEDVTDSVNLEVTFGNSVGTSYSFVANDGYEISGYVTGDGSFYETLEEIITADMHITENMIIKPVCVLSDDSVTSLTASLTDSDYLQPTLYVKGDDVTVDWGDGEISTGTGTITKETAYDSTGSYVISISSDGEYTLGGATSSTSVLSNDYRTYLKQVRTGSNAGVQAYTFNNCTGLINADLSSSGTAGTSLARLFFGCTSLATLDISGLDTSDVTNMSYMFYNCPALEALDVTGLDTSSSTTLAYMFYNCTGLTELDVSGFDTSNVTNLQGTFYLLENVTNLDVSSWNTSKVTNLHTTFCSLENVTELDVSNWDTSKVTNMTSTFLDCSSLKSLDVSNWDTSNVKIMSGAFARLYECKTLNISGLDTSKVTNMNNMFMHDYLLTELDISSFDTSNVTSMSGMFYYDYSLQSLDVSGFDTSSVASMDTTFYYCAGLKELDLSNFDTTNVTSMNSFAYGCRGLEELDLSGFYLPNLTSFNYSFAGCTSLKSIDLSNTGPTQVTNIAGMFYGDSNLEEIIWDEDFSTGVVTSSGFMYYNCSGLDKIDLSFITTDPNVRVDYMFYGCSNVKELDLSGFDLSDIYGTFLGTLGGTNGVLTGCDSLEVFIYPSGASLAVELPAVDGYAWYNEDETVCTEAAAELSDDMTYVRDIVRTEITEDMFTVDTSDETYSSHEITKEITSDLVLDKDYTVTYSDNINAGTATITIKGIGNYIGTLEYTFTINKATYDMSGVTFDDMTYVYDGTEKALTVTGTLPAGVSVSYSENALTNAGSIEVTASFTGDADNYEAIDDMTATLTISKAVYDMSDVSFTDASYTYDGTEKSIVISGELPDGVTVAYEDNTLTEIGSVTATAHFTGDDSNYEPIPDMTAVLTVTNAVFDDMTVTAEGYSGPYDGEAHTVSITLSGDASDALVTYSTEKDGDYTSEAPEFTDIGTYEVYYKVSKENYDTLEGVLTVNITKAVYDMSGVTFEDATYTYDGTQKSLSISGKLPNGVSVSYENNALTNVGSVIVTAHFTGDDSNYEAIPDMTATLTVTACKLDDSMFTVDTSDEIYTGQAITKKITSSLKKDVDYTVSYSNNINKGTATIKITGKGNYTGTITKTFKINPRSISSAKITISNKTYTGKTIKPSFSVKIGSTTLKAGTDYTYSFSNNKNVGTATLKVTGKGNYTGTVTKTFKINPKTTSISKLTKAKKGFTVKWSKKTTQTTGYQVRYSTSSKMTNAKTVTVKNYKTTSKKLSKLKSQKKYYVQVRTYKTVNGKNYYSSWSKAKSVKTK